MKLTYRQAIKKVEEFLTEHLLTDEQKQKGNTTVTIHDWYGNDDRKVASRERKKRPWVGVRVSEVSIVTRPAEGGGLWGSSYMQSDFPFGMAFCAEVEKCIIALIEDWNDGAQQETDEEFERLKWIIDQETLTALGR